MFLVSLLNLSFTPFAVAPNCSSGLLQFSLKQHCSLSAHSVVSIFVLIIMIIIVSIS